jgi:RHS repeat-associated protein
MAELLLTGGYQTIDLTRFGYQRILDGTPLRETGAYNGPRLTTITDTVGRQVALSYDSAGQLQTIQDAAGRVVRYGLDLDGRLAFMWDRLANAGPPTPYRNRVLANNPAAYWRLGESSGTTAADASPNGISGTYNGGVTLGAAGAIAGDTDTAIYVNGSGYVSASGTGLLNVTGSALSVEGWVRGSSQANYTYILSKTDGGGTMGYALYTGGSGTLSFFVNTSGSGLVTATAASSPWDNRWHYITGTYDGARVRLYIDGARVASVAATGTITSSSTIPLNLGRYSGGGLAFVGYLDEFAISPSVLSDADIVSRMYGKPSWQFTYDGSSRHIASVTDPDGRVTVTNTYDALGRLATQQDGLNKTTTLGYPASQTTLTDPRGHITTVTYDARNRPIQQDDPVGASTYHLYYTYDNCGNRASVTDRNGNRSDFTYDTACKGNLLQRQEPQLNPQTPRFTTTWTYDTKNNPTLRTDAKGFTTTWTYDPTTNVRLSEARQIDGLTSATTKWIYGDTNNPGLPTRVVAPRGNTTGTPDNTYSTVLGYDTTANLGSSTDADGNKTTYAYDNVGRRTSMVDPDGNAVGGIPSEHTWTTAYDALDRVTTETDPLARSTSYTYDGAGNRTSATDKNGNVTNYAFDAAGRLATVKQKPNPTGQPTLVYTTTVTRDDNGNATNVTQANGVVTDYSYDAINRLISMTTHPATGTNLVTSYTLDGNGNTLTRTTADSVVTTYSYDNLSRLTQVSATGLSTISYGYDELSRRTSTTDGTGATTYSYDRMDRLTQAGQPNGTVSYGYDLDSDRTTLTYPGSSAVTYTYSNAGRLSGLTDWGSRVTSYAYSAAGLVKNVTVPNGLVTTYTYDRARRLTAVTNVVGSTTITSHSYTLDNQGNRTVQTEFVSGITTGASDSFGYTYDGLNRLTGVTTTNAEGFTLDAASNIASRTGPSATYSYDTSNRVTGDGSQTFTWSNADRLTNRGSDTFGYDPLDRLTSSTVSGVSRSYAYNADGLLQSRTQGSTTTFLWDPATSPSRLLQIGTDKIVYGLGPLYVATGSGTTTFARDGGKSVRAELNGSGAVTASFRYRAYGAIAQSSGSSTPTYLGYAGQLLDPSGLYYMRARWMDPATGRFLTRDELDGEPELPATLNPFTYAGSSPSRLWDPTGLAIKLLDNGMVCACVLIGTEEQTADDPILFDKCVIVLLCVRRVVTTTVVETDDPETTSTGRLVATLSGAAFLSADNSNTKKKKRAAANLTEEQLDMTLDDFIGRFLEGRVRREIPGEFLQKTVREALQSGISKVRKFVTNLDYRK